MTGHNYYTMDDQEVSGPNWIICLGMGNIYYGGQ